MATNEYVTNNECERRHLLVRSSNELHKGFTADLFNDYFHFKRRRRIFEIILQQQIENINTFLSEI